MSQMLEQVNELFAAGYDKGRADGVRQAITVASLAMDRYPNRLSATSMAILPEAEGSALAKLIQLFGDDMYRQGKRDEKAKAKKAEASNHGAAI